ncbi:tobamovirus multiplication protein 2A-like isoform X2 [Papaver somniferum]|uniref:tobamovirus multiplication protein 2A-like isoform X2 n=1 Tax=Papaver somniferum TaxID=3469 RepID=UPI000E6FC90B|nr:tobamovirus multiplication protein 2A-like isoform X2 [Papaver somniferum]
MAKKQLFEFILKTLNILLLLCGLALVGFGTFHLVKWTITSNEVHSDNMKQYLSSVWFLIFFIAVGTILFAISCSGCIGISARNRCCLYLYSVFMAILVLFEIGLGAFVAYDRRWKERIPKDKTGKLNSSYAFIETNWEILRWVALGAVVLEVLALLLSVGAQLSRTRAFYDSSDEEFDRYQQFQRMVPPRQVYPASRTPSPTIGNNQKQPAIQLSRAGV